MGRGEYQHLKSVGQETGIISVTSSAWKTKVTHSSIMKHRYYYRKVSPGDCPEVFTCRKHMTVNMNQSCVN